MFISHSPSYCDQIFRREEHCRCKNFTTFFFILENRHLMCYALHCSMQNILSMKMLNISMAEWINNACWEINSGIMLCCKWENIIDNLIQISCNCCLKWQISKIKWLLLNFSFISCFLKKLLTKQWVKENIAEKSNSKALKMQI